MKTKLPVILVAFFMALVTATAARGDDATITKQLIGRWETPGGITVLRPDGTSDPYHQKWKVRDGVLIIEINPNRDDEFKIISLTKDRVVIQDLFHGHHTGTWTRITAGR